MHNTFMASSEPAVSFQVRLHEVQMWKCWNVKAWIHISSLQLSRVPWLWNRILEITVSPERMVLLTLDECFWEAGTVEGTHSPLQLQQPLDSQALNLLLERVPGSFFLGRLKFPW